MKRGERQVCIELLKEHIEIEITKDGRANKNKNHTLKS